MLVVRDIRVRSLSVDYAHVIWQIEPTTEDLSLYNFYVLRSGGQEGPYETVSSPLVDTYVWRDNWSQDVRAWGGHYYRILVEHRGTGETQEFGQRTPEEVTEGHAIGGVSYLPEPTPIGREISRRQDLVNRIYAGRDYLIFQRRVFGQRCPTCWDPIQRQMSESRCKTCFGSSFVGGYYRPIQVALSKSVAPRVDDLGPMKKQSEAVSFRLASFPEIKPGDMIVEVLGNRRWRVNQVVPSYVQGALVSQQLVGALIIKSDIEYSVPVRGIDPIRFEAIAAHHYEGAVNTESQIEIRNRRDPLEV